MADGQEGSLGVELTEESFRQTFEVVDGYNEWRVKGAAVAGMFVSDPSSIFVKRTCSIKVDSECVTEIAPVRISLKEALDTFPDLKHYTMQGGNIVELRAPGEGGTRNDA